MMGEVVGKAAAVCIQHNATPRELYTQHLSALQSLLKKPGATRGNI